MKKSRVKRSKKNNSNIFKIIGIIALILIIAIAIILFLKKDSSSDKKTDNSIIPSSECLAINLKISEINPSTNMLKITRLAGAGNLYQIKISVNANPLDNLLASDIKEDATKIFIVNTNPGDKVEIAPILKDGAICSVSDTKIA
ncbi:MAG: hypothetical protein Q8N63_02185 [Nanoarchaeota archaeon]|nr:hypothetical protein [Nanoarchaeota archaeon]